MGRTTKKLLGPFFCTIHPASAPVNPKLPRSRLLFSMAKSRSQECCYLFLTNQPRWRIQGAGTLFKFPYTNSLLLHGLYNLTVYEYKITMNEILGLLPSFAYSLHEFFFLSPLGWHTATMGWFVTNQENPSSGR